MPDTTYPRLVCSVCNRRESIPVDVSDLSEDEIFDMLRRTAGKFGWSVKLVDGKNVIHCERCAGITTTAPPPLLPENLPPFPESGQCRKCGSDNLDMKWCPQCLMMPAAEHMHFCCRKCRFEWITRCMAQLPERKWFNWKRKKV